MRRFTWTTSSFADRTTPGVRISRCARPPASRPLLKSGTGKWTVRVDLLRPIRSPGTVRVRRRTGARRTQCEGFRYPIVNTLFHGASDSPSSSRPVCRFVSWVRCGHVWVRDGGLVMVRRGPAAQVSELGYLPEQADPRMRDHFKPISADCSPENRFGSLHQRSAPS